VGQDKRPAVVLEHDAFTPAKNRPRIPLLNPENGTRHPLAVLIDNSEKCAAKRVRNGQNSINSVPCETRLAPRLPSNWIISADEMGEFCPRSWDPSGTVANSVAKQSFPVAQKPALGGFGVAGKLFFFDVGVWPAITPRLLPNQISACRNGQIVEHIPSPSHNAVYCGHCDQ
jgi:hypothetical protein